MDDNKNQKEQKINVNAENTKVLYTDNIYMVTNNFGVVLDVTQRIANTNQFQVVNRINHLWSGIEQQNNPRLIDN